MSKHVVPDRCAECREPFAPNDKVIFAGSGVIAETRHHWNSPDPGRFYVQLRGGGTAYHVDCWSDKVARLGGHGIVSS